MSETNLITKIKNEVPRAEEKKIAPYSFSTPEWKRLKVTLLTRGKLDPGADKEMFDRITAARGYNFYSSQSQLDWQEVYGWITNADLYKTADLDYRAFMKSVQDPSDVDHDKNRMLFKSLEGNEEGCRRYFIEKNNNANGRDTMVLQNQSHEANILKGSFTNPQAVIEGNILKQLFISKWQAMGHYLDEEYRAKFIADYCLALTENYQNEYRY